MGFAQIEADVISVVGGFHTTGYLMTWLLWYLASNPASQDRLLDELKREVGGECGDRLKTYALRTDTYVCVCDKKQSVVGGQQHM